MKIIISKEGDNITAKMLSAVEKNILPANTVHVSAKLTKSVEDKTESAKRKDVLQQIVTHKELTFAKVSEANRYTSRKILAKPGASFAKNHMNLEKTSQLPARLAILVK